MARRKGPLTVDGEPMTRADGTQILRRSGEPTRALVREQRARVARTSQLQRAGTPQERAAVHWDDVRRIAKHADDPGEVWRQIEQDLSMLAQRLRDWQAA
jgi:hypothetical protein